MRILKFFFVGTILLSLLSPSTLFAQVESGGSPPPPPPNPNGTYEPQTTIPEPPAVAPGDEISFDLGEVYILDLQLDKAEYKNGETVRGTFNIENHSKKDSISDVYYQITLQGNYTNGVAMTTYDKQKYGPLFLRAQELRPIQFAYTVPEKIGGKTSIQVQAFLKSGIPMGWDEEIVTVQGESNFVTVTTSILQIGDKVFSPHIGPPVYEGQQPKLKATLSNPSSKSVTIVPNIDVYRMSVLSAPLKSYTEPNFTLAAKGTKEISFDLPVFDYEPSVYTGTIVLNDTDGKKIGATLSFRYTIVGERVTIFSIFPSKTSFQKNETLTLRINYAGPAIDMITEKAPKIGTLPTHIKIFNENNELAGETSVNINFDAPQNNKEVELKTTQSARASRIEAQVLKDGKVIGEYTNTLSPEEEQEKPTTPSTTLSRLAMGGILFIFLLIGVLALFRWKKSAGTLAIFIALAIPTFFLSAGESHAQSAYYNGPTSWNGGDFRGSWSPNPIPYYMAPGQVFSINGSYYLRTCMNALPSVRFYAELQWPPSYNYTSWGWQQWNFTTGNHQFAEFNRNWSIGGSNYLKAPYTPGTYNVILKWQNQNGDTIISGYYTIKVPFPAASIGSFYPSPSTINLGASTRLYWYASNVSTAAGGCSISGVAGGLPANSSYPVTPNVTTTYTLTCVNGDGIASAARQTTVTVIPIKINFFQPQPNLIEKGKPSMLSWSTTGAARCTIPNVGTFYPGSSATVYPTQDTPYSLTCYSSSGASVSASTNIQVLYINNPEASPSIIGKGKQAQLKWSTSSGTTCSVSDGGSYKPATSPYPVTPQDDTTYTIKCSRGGISTEKSILIRVLSASGFDGGPTNKTVLSGSDVSFLWNQKNATSCEVKAANTNGTGTPRILSGTLATATDQPTQDTTYTLTCYNNTVTPQAEYTFLTTITIKILEIPTFSINPTEINRGQSTLLTWITKNAATCTANSTPTPGDSTWTYTNPPINDSQRSKSVTPPSLPSGSTPRNYSLTCTGLGGIPSIIKSLAAPGLKVHTLLTKIECSKDNVTFGNCANIKAIAGSAIYLKDMSEPTPGSTISNRVWTFSNGSPSQCPSTHAGCTNSQIPKVSFLKEGTQTATLVVTDSAGETETITKTFKISKPSFQETAPQ